MSADEKYPMTTLNDLTRRNSKLVKNGGRKNGENHVKIRPYSLKDAFFDFTQDTTFHGIRYISAKDSLLFRRFIWVCVILFCTTLLTRQIVDRVRYYYDWPVTVKVEINYNDSLTFPAVAICNMNSFRVTEATRLGFYPLLEEIYGPNAKDFHDVDLSAYKASDTMEHILNTTAHIPDDMIVWCLWNNARCGKSDFTPIFTDNGLCYAFNHNGSQKRWSNETGANSGLRLIMNVEQYEYMHGPHDSAGLKMLLYDHNEVPLVQDLGQALSVGTHTYAGIKVLLAKNLPEPHGECTSSNPSSYYKTYTQIGCSISCITNFLYNLCDCRLAYMPHKNGHPKVCTLKQQQCITKVMKSPKLGKMLREFNCQFCSIPCQSTHYEPNFSYSTTSYLDVDKVKSMLDSKALLKRYIKARDTKAAVVTKYHTENSDAIKTIMNASSDVEDILYGINDTVREFSSSLNSLMNEVQQAWTLKNDILLFQEHVTDKNYYRGITSMDERAWGEVARGYFQFVFIYQQNIKRLAEIGVDQLERKMLYATMMETIRARKSLAEMSLENCNLAFASYWNGSQLADYPYNTTREDDAKTVTPVELLRSALTRSSEVNLFLEQAKTHLGRIIGGCDDMGNYLTLVYSGHKPDSDRVRSLTDSFTKSVREFNKDRNYLLKDIYWYPVKIMADRKQTFKELQINIDDTNEDMKIHLEKIRTGFYKVMRNQWPEFQYALEVLSNYIVNNSLGWTEISKVSTSPKMDSVIENLKQYFDDVRSRSQSLQDDWIKLRRQSLNIWEEILTDKDSQAYYRKYSDKLLYGNVSWAEVNLTSFRVEQNDRLKELESNFNLLQLLGSADANLTSALGKLQVNQRRYLSENKIGTTFYRENFLQVDIFYRKLSYEVVEQQKAYEIFALLSDIGGSMGLFVGASIVTVFEVIDLLGYHFCRRKNKIDDDEDDEMEDGTAI